MDPATENSYFHFFFFFLVPQSINNFNNPNAFLMIYIADANMAAPTISNFPIWPHHILLMKCIILKTIFNEV